MSGQYKWPSGYKGPVHATMDLSEYTHTVHIIKENETEVLNVLVYYETLDFTEPNNYQSKSYTSQLKYNFKYKEDAN
jgi:hypothetical protein